MSHPRTICYKMGFFGILHTVLPLSLYLWMLELGTIPVMVESHRVSGVAPSRCWVRRCSTMVHIFHRHLKAAPVRPMAARGHPPHFKTMTTAKAAIREPPKLRQFSRPSAPPYPPLTTTGPSPGGMNPNTGTPKVERKKERTLQLSRASEEICGGSSNDGQLS